MILEVGPKQEPQPVVTRLELISLGNGSVALEAHRLGSASQTILLIQQDGSISFIVGTFAPLGFQTDGETVKVNKRY